MHISSNELKGHLAMLAFSGLVAGSFALGVRVANDITPAAFTLIRFVIAVSILLTIILIKTEFTKRVFDAPWRFFALGACIAIYFVLMFEGLKVASSVSLAAVFTFAPLLSGFFGYLLMRQKMSLSIFMALIIGGIDMFDCVLPTRSGRTGLAFTWEGRINIKNNKYQSDNTPLDKNCKNLNLNKYSKNYLNHLFNTNEILGSMLLTLHNINFYQELMRAIRENIQNDTFDTFHDKYIDKL